MTTNNAVNVGLSSVTGAGAFVGANAPTIAGATLVSPKIISSLQDTNGNTWINVGAVASAVNYIQINNGITGNNPIVAAVGTDTNITMVLKGQGTGTATIIGTSTNDDAGSGFVGELVSSIVSNTSPVSLVTATSKTVTSISLTAGDWDVYGMIGTIAGSGTLTTVLVGSISSINNTRETDVNETVNYTVSSASSTPSLVTPYVRLSLSTTTTYYLIATALFTVSTLSAFGKIQARRAR